MVTAKGYPTLELPVVRFTSPEDAEYYQQGASALANLVLRHAIDHSAKTGPSVREFLDARNLWIRATFEGTPKLMHTELQRKDETLWLIAGRYRGEFFMRWTQQPDGIYIPDRIKKYDSTLPSTSDQKILEITPQTYDALPTEEQLQADPALQLDAVFGRYASGDEVAHPLRLMKLSVEQFPKE